MSTHTATDLASSTAPTTKPIVRYAVTAARILLGLCFFVFGLNGFFNFIPPPSSPPPEGAMAFAGALMQTGYMFKMIKGVEVLVGALLLSNRFVPLALILLAPVSVNIFAFHFFLAPDGILLAAVILLLQIALAWAYRGSYRTVLAARARPSA